MAKVAGICFIKANDTQFEVEGSVECPLSQNVREPVESLEMSKGHFSEKRIAPYVKLSAILDPSIPINKLANDTDITVTAEIANGWVYTLTGAYLADEQVIKGDEGKVDLMFNGITGEWKTS